MSFAKRIEALEVAAIKADGPKRFDVFRTVFAPDRNIVGVYRYVVDDAGCTALVPVTSDEPGCGNAMEIKRLSSGSNAKPATLGGSHHRSNQLKASRLRPL